MFSFYLFTSRQLSFPVWEKERFPVAELERRQVLELNPFLFPGAGLKLLLLPVQLPAGDDLQFRDSILKLFRVEIDCCFFPKLQLLTFR